MAKKKNYKGQRQNKTRSLCFFLKKTASRTYNRWFFQNLITALKMSDAPQEMSFFKKNDISPTDYFSKSLSKLSTKRGNISGLFVDAVAFGKPPEAAFIQTGFRYRLSTIAHCPKFEAGKVRKSVPCDLF